MGIDFFPYCFKIHTQWNLYLFLWIKLKTKKVFVLLWSQCMWCSAQIATGCSRSTTERHLNFSEEFQRRASRWHSQSSLLPGLLLRLYKITDGHTKLPLNRYLLLLDQLNCIEKVQMLPLFSFSSCVDTTRGPYNLRGGRWSLYVVITYQRTGSGIFLLSPKFPAPLVNACSTCFFFASYVTFFPRRPMSSTALFLFISEVFHLTCYFMSAGFFIGFASTL